MSDEIIREEKPEEKMPENMDEVIKNVVKDIKNKKEISGEQLETAMKTANENLEFLNVLEEIKLECPNDRVIYVDGNEELVYDNGEFFLCDTINSKKPRKKIKRKEATEKYIEYFIRFQLNPIIEQKKINNLTKTVMVNEKVNEVQEIKVPVKELEKKEPEKKEPEKKELEKIKELEITKEPPKKVIQGRGR